MMIPQGTACSSDGNPCTEDICIGGNCWNPPEPNGTSCPNDGNSCTDDECQGGFCDHPDHCPVGQNCCDNGTCCDITCDACIGQNGSLSGGTIDVNPAPACINDTITFTASGVEDSGGQKRENCVVVSDGPVTPDYTWSLTIPPDYPTPLPPLTGTGSSVGVAALVGGNYSATFTATANRDCPPPPITIGPVSIDSASCCDASTATNSISVEFPSWSGFNSALESAATAAPMIQSLTLTLEGDTTATRGETCCELATPPPTLPLTYYDYSVSATLGISVTLNVPGWNWAVSATWPNVGSAVGQITLGPTLSLSPSASASVTGRSVIDFDCPDECVTLNGSAGVGVSGTFGGSATLDLTIDLSGPWSGWGTTVGATAEAGASTSANLTGSYIVPGCQTGSSGFQGGEICYGALQGTVTLSFTVFGVSYEYSTLATFLDGGCW